MAKLPREVIEWIADQDVRDVTVTPLQGLMTYDGPLTGKIPKGIGPLVFVGMNRKDRRSLTSKSRR